MADFTQLEKGAAGGRLDNNAVNASQGYKNGEKSPDLRESRYAAREAVRLVTHRANVRKCGRVRHSPYVELRDTDGAASYSGVISCGAVWLCPPCQAKIAAHRALEVAAITQYATSAELPMLFGALTLRHTVDDSLAELLAMLRQAWRRTTSGRGWKEIEEYAGGKIRFIRSLEINEGANGWHPHLHPLAVLPREQEPGQARRVAERIAVRWMTTVHTLGGIAEFDAQSLDVVRNAPEVGAYILGQVYGGKAHRGRIDLEMTAAQNKSQITRARGTRSHWGILEDLANGVDLERTKALYWNLEAHSYRHRQMTWSRTVRADAGLLAPLTDEAVAETPEGVVVAHLTAQGWDRLYALGLPLKSLQTLESGGWEAVSALWAANQVEFVLDLP
jgi:hypothetical protein